MRIFVTGGSGFIGRHLVESLLQKESQVTIFDDLSNSTEEGISHLVKNGAQFVKGDITDYSTLAKSLSGYDVVVHLAAKISVDESVVRPEVTTLVNVNGTVNLLKACVANKIQNVIAASSAGVYADSDEMPLSENSKTQAISPYSASKLAMEYYMQAFANCFDMNCISLRIFNVYGAGQSRQYAGVITKFVQNIVANKPLIIFGDGTQTRDFVAIEDVVNAIQCAISKIDGKRGNVYNISSGKFVSIKDLAELMISLSGKELPIKFEDTKKGDIKNSQSNIFLAKKELRYNPKVELEEGIENFLKLFS